MDFNISMITVRRSNNNYINNTLESFCNTQPQYVLNLMVHNTADQLDFISLDFQNNPLINVVPLTPEEAERIKDWHVHRKFNHNYHRALAFPDIKPEQYKITMEDDLEFDPAFWAKLNDILTLNSIQSRTAIALYACYDNGPKQNKLSEYYVNSYYGTQCMLYTPDIVPGAADFIKMFGSESYNEPGDMLLKAFLRSNAYCLYHSHRSLVQHIGYVSTGLGNHHMSGTYKQGW